MVVDISIIKFIIPCIFLGAVLFLLLVPFKTKDDFTQIPDDLPKENKNGTFNTQGSDSIILSSIINLFCLLLPKSLWTRITTPPKPKATFINSKGDLIRFYNKRENITHLITNFMVLIAYIIIGTLVVLYACADVMYGSSKGGFDRSFVELLNKIFINKGEETIFSSKDYNLIFLMAGFGAIGLYLWLFSAIELFILKQNYHFISIGWRINTALFVILPIILCCFLPTKALQFVACFVAFAGFLVSQYMADMSKIKAKLQKEYNL